MAKYQITRSCGHQEDVQIAGKVSERANIEAKESQKLCRACFAAKLAEENQKALAESKSEGLPELTGTEKQIAWAAKIRQSVLSGKSQIEKTIQERTPEQNKAAAFDMLNEAVNNLLNRTEASWWIDNRNVNIEQELRVVFEKKMK